MHPFLWLKAKGGMLLFLLLMIVPGRVVAQEAETPSWQVYLASLYGEDEMQMQAMEEAYEVLTDLEQQPLNVNTAEVEQLLQIPGLTIDQVSDIIQYREKYGEMKSIDELSMIPSIDNNLRRFISHFLIVTDASGSLWSTKEGRKGLLRRMKHEVTYTAGIPTYYRAGDRGASSVNGETKNKYADKYLGSPLRHSLRYSLSVGNDLKVNITGANNAAEPFFSGRNTMGYDSYAYNVSIRNAGIFSQIVAGTFRARFGMGLTMNNNFTLGKQTVASSLGKGGGVFSPHSSASDSRHLQGIAATAMLGRWNVSGFLSWRYIDATLNDDGTISTILTSGYHRTETEMQKKNNASQTTAGAHVGYRVVKPGMYFSVGVSAVYSHLNTPINPVFSKADTVSNSRLYRLFYPTGSTFSNYGADYTLRYHDITLAGETATGSSGGIATINGVTWKAPYGITLTGVYRFYSYRYASLYASSLSEGGAVQNESGAYIGIGWSRLRYLTLNFYTDIAYFPWKKYRVSDASRAFDNCLTATYSRDDWSLAVRYRLKSKQKDMTTTDDEGNARKQLAYRTDQRLRFIFSLDRPHWQAKSQVEGCLLKFDGTSNGIIVSQSLGYKAGNKWSVYGTAAYFTTDDYDSRLYTYERGMQYGFGYSSYYGQGMRLSVVGSYAPFRWMKVLAKVGHTRYFDRSTIGTAERMIFSNRQTDIDLQVKFKL